MPLHATNTRNDSAGKVFVPLFRAFGDTAL